MTCTRCQTGGREPKRKRGTGKAALNFLQKLLKTLKMAYKCLVASRVRMQTQERQKLRLAIPYARTGPIFQSWKIIHKLLIKLRL